MTPANPMRVRQLFALLALFSTAALLVSCGSSGNPNTGRVLISVAVTPATADGQSSPNGVVFTATGTFSLPPITAPLNFAAPYAGQFVIDNTSVATIVATGTGTITVQCVSGTSGTVFATAGALANNGTSTMVSGSGRLTCP